MKEPLVSIIIPTYNAGDLLENCLKSILRQNYKNFEIFIVDGGSTDNTLTIAKKYRVTILDNPSKDAESGKSIGVQYARGQIIALIDADNEIVQENWLEKMLQPFLEQTDIWGVESPWLLRKEDALINKYVTLLKIADPLARRFHPHLSVEDYCDYQVYTSKLRTPVVGANGFLWRKDIILKINEYIPKFEEVNYTEKVLRGGYYKFARPKYVGIHHHYCDSIAGFARKRIKIGRKFLARKEKRQDTWVDNISKIKFMGAVIYNISIIGPLFEAAREYRRTSEIAWFLHPFFSFLTILIYFYVTATFYLTKFRKIF